MQPLEQISEERPNRPSQLEASQVSISSDGDILEVESKAQDEDAEEEEEMEDEEEEQQDEKDEEEVPEAPPAEPAQFPETMHFVRPK